MTDSKRRAKAQAELEAFGIGYELKELRKSMGMTQREVAQILGTTQPRVSQIENGELEGLELSTLRSYVAALGGSLDIIATVGPRSVRVA